MQRPHLTRMYMQIMPCANWPDFVVDLWIHELTEQSTEFDISRFFEELDIKTKERHDMKHSGAKQYKQGMNKQMKFMK